MLKSEHLVGGAGLIAGIAIAVKSLRPDIKIIVSNGLVCSFSVLLKGGGANFF